MTRLTDLFTQQGQSPWIDDLKRSYVRQGGLAELAELGIRGVTSNPSIMTKAIEAGTDYDEQFGELIRADVPIEDAYWELVLADVTGALDILRPLYNSSKGGDGFVSVEVAPDLAHDTEGTIASARSLHSRIDRPNLFVKIPATTEGIPAIEEMIASGKKINVTLIFSLERYEAVIEAYLTGLERLISSGGDASSVASVASFFVSRVDTEVDRRLEAIAGEEPGAPRSKQALDLRGKAALAQARVAYSIFQDRFSTARFEALTKKGARTQRPLWASTSTKNPSYPDLLYVNGLIGPDTVDTMPYDTAQAFLDHGTLARTVDSGIAEEKEVLSSLAEVGVDLDDVTLQLENEGVAAFAKSFDELHERLEEKAAALRSSP
ncbi:MAG TPA: transaldolase [Acidimicrobiales bacterium]|nr:transaldolase [Acidimicrobiales bacterium]